MRKLRLALMDMNNGVPNQGMRGLRNITDKFVSAKGKFQGLQVDEFEVRKKHQVPGIEYDIYISSGGPGDPRRNTKPWEQQWHSLIDQIWKHNQTAARKKFVFFVCHSFQMACRHFDLCKVTRRKSTSFGIYPIHKTEKGKEDRLLEKLGDPYFGVDSRDWQLVKPNRKRFKEIGASILSLEKIRTHVEYERAIMAVRFSPELVGTQFHPEADPEGMNNHFSKRVNREKVINNFSIKKYNKMMKYLESPEAITKTYNTIIPGFLNRAIKSLSSGLVEEYAA